MNALPLQFRGQHTHLGEKIPIKLPADTCTLDKRQQKSLLVWPFRFPLHEMFFVTEEPHPLSVAIDKMRHSTVFICCHRVPFAQRCCDCATAHRPIHRDRYRKLNRLLTKATRRGDRCFCPDPMHDGNGNRPARSHTVELGPPWNVHAIRTRGCRERIQDHHLPTACIIFEKVDAVEPFNTRCDFLS